MLRILLSGCNGAMGKVITNCVAERDDCEIVAGLDVNTADNDKYPIFGSADDINVKADVIIDFSHPSALSGVLKYALSTKTPAVISTTGLSEEQINSLHLASSQIPIFFSANMSLGVSLVSELVKKAASVLGANFDIEIIETHHNKKIDAPSGTALAIADAIADTMTDDAKYVYERQSVRKQREKSEIGIHAIRGGTIVGDHDVIYAGPDEVITLSHSAASREVFAQGAVKAAMFMAGKPKGFYCMDDLFN